MSPNPLAIGVVTYLAISVELGLRAGLAISSPQAFPMLVLPIVVFVCMHGQAGWALWFAMLAGLLVDMMGAGGPPWPAIGPQALGYLLAAVFVVTVRGVVNRRNSLAFAAVTGGAALLSAVVVVAVLAARGWIEPLPTTPRVEMGVRMLVALYTAGAALLMWFLLKPMTSVLGLNDPQSRRYGF